MATTESTFVLAVRAYINEPTKKKRPSFIDKYLVDHERIGPEDVQATLVAVEKQHSQRPGNIFRLVFEALYDYDGILGAMSQADPMPSALVWGGLKAVLECFKRYDTLVEKIKQHLKSLTDELRRLKRYESLFIHSEEIRKLLTSSYINIIKFWAKVDQQFTSGALKRAAKSLTSSSLKSLDGIISDIVEEGKNILKWVPIIQEEMRRSEHEVETSERQTSILALEELVKKEKELRGMQRKNQIRERRAEVINWIRDNAMPNGSNSHRQRILDARVSRGIGKWLFSDESYERWSDASPSPGGNVLWLNGGPGVGKSVMCAHAVSYTKETYPSSAVSFYYYSLDEPDGLLTIYRSIAEQLFYELYGTLGDVSDQIFDLAQSLLTEKALKEFIITLVSELKSTYIFIDGIDEACDNKQVWEDANDMLTFFINLAKTPNSTLKLWCSSIDRRAIQEKMIGVESIQLNASTNGQDIDIFLTREALQTPIFVELDAPTRELFLQDLKSQVNGNFLWASMMVETIREDTSLTCFSEMQDMIREGLPGDFEEYLEKRVKSLKRTQSGIPPRVLSCLVYAKRPLTLDELCDAVEAYNSDFGQDLGTKQRIFRSRVVEGCAPLVRVETVGGSESVKQICTLCHGSVRRFLDKNPTVLGSDELRMISPKFLAVACLKYLQQPRYRKLLQKMKRESFATHDGQDIARHHLLTYSVKYWISHLCEVDYDPELAKELDHFLRSTNFVTCLQVQSLLLEGSFSNSEKRRHSKAFPQWFSEKHPGGRDLLHQYDLALSEWGYYLDSVSTIRGKYPGDIARCLWASLGKQNFLHQVFGRVESHPFANRKSSQTPAQAVAVYDSINLDGKELTTFKVENYLGDSAGTELRCERWSLERGHRPKLQLTQILPLEDSDTALNQLYPVGTLPGRTPIIRGSEDGVVVHIGSTVYWRTRGSEFQPLGVSHEMLDFVEELSSNGKYFAIASRKRASKRKQQQSGDLKAGLNGKADAEDTRSVSSSDTESSESEKERTSRDGRQDHKKQTSRTGSADSTLLGTMRILLERDRSLSPELEYYGDLGSDSNSSLSAQESCSETSTAPLSDELRVWNAHGFNDEELRLEAGDFSDGASDEVREGPAPSDDEGSSIKSIDTEEFIMKFGTWRVTDFSSFLAGARDRRRRWDHPPSTKSTEDGPDMPTHGTALLDQFLQPNQLINLTGQVSEIQVFKMENQDAEPKRLFRYFEPSLGQLESSSPVFHPTQNVIVWPLGGGKILFANFGRKRYQILRSSAEYENTCRISTQCRFSLCGQYLHLACIDGSADAVGNMNPAWPLRLQVSTYRLSKRKLWRSPPRLIYHTSCDLGSARSEQDTDPPSELRYTATWTRDHIYVTESKRVLSVLRVALYRDIERHEVTGTLHKSVFKNKSDVYLPASAERRRVYFFPTIADPVQDIPSGLKKKHLWREPSRAGEEKEDVVATVILSSPKPTKSAPSAEDASDEMNLESRPAVVVYLTETQFGGWEPLEAGIDGIKPLKKAPTWRGGQLLSKFEMLDLSAEPKPGTS